MELKNRDEKVDGMRGTNLRGVFLYLAPIWSPPGETMQTLKDPGGNVSAARTAGENSQYKPLILGLSALLTTTMSEMNKVIEKLKFRALRESVKTMRNGTLVNRDFAKGIDGDGYAVNAYSVVALANLLLNDGCPI